MPKAESDAKGCGKPCKGAGKQCKMQKIGQSAENEAKRGAKSKQRGGQHALGLQQAKEAIKREKRRAKQNRRFKMAVSIGRWQHQRPTLDAGIAHVQHPLQTDSMHILKIHAF